MVILRVEAFHVAASFGTRLVTYAPRHTITFVRNHWRGSSCSCRSFSCSSLSGSSFSCSSFSGSSFSCSSFSGSSFSCSSFSGRSFSCSILSCSSNGSCSRVHDFFCALFPWLFAMPSWLLALFCVNETLEFAFTASTTLLAVFPFAVQLASSSSTNLFTTLGFTVHFAFLAWKVTPIHKLSDYLAILLGILGYTVD